MKQAHEVIADLIRANMDPADTRHGILTAEEEIHLIDLCVGLENHLQGEGGAFSTAQYVAKVEELLPELLPESRKGLALKPRALEHAAAVAEQIPL
tara:strand:- start:6333 stop:6620 length:288 start_codon:yes stop_codon:yes gene_type:complete